MFLLASAVAVRSGEYVNSELLQRVIFHPPLCAQLSL